jgi:peptide chain release factor 1
MEKLLAKVVELEQEFSELERLLSDHSAPSRPDFPELSRRYNRLHTVVEKGKELRRLLRNIAEEEELLRQTPEEDLARELRQELERDRERAEALAKELQQLLIPPHPDAHKNAIVEIRAGAGGEEAALFAADLFRMYVKYAEKKGFSVRVLDSHPTDLGGFKEIIFAVEGPGSYGLFRYESGVHRVQRVPDTEASGRIHTSTATVAVLPEAEEAEVEIRPEALRIETFRSSGPGGQHMQKNETAVRITHIPTGIVATCQEERSQHRNKELALRVLRAKLRELEKQKKEAELQEQRRRQIGTGERSEKIRTYNFPQNRVTEHRIDLTIYRLEEVLEGELDLVVEPLLSAEATRLLSSVER